MSLIEFIKSLKKFLIINDKLDLEISMTKEELQKYKSDEKVSYNGYFFKIIHYLLNDEYLKLQRIFERDVKLGISIMVNKTLVFLDTEVGFISVLEKMKNSNMLSRSEIKKYEKLKKSIEYDNLYYKNKLITYVYDQKLKSFPVNKIYNLFLLEYDEFKNIIENNNFGISHDEFLMILLKYVIEYANDQTLILPNHIKLKANLIREKTKASFVLDKIHLHKTPSYMKNINMNSDFEKYVLNQIPLNYSNIEKAFYIYLLLCRIFTYDAIEVNGSKSNINHKNIERIKEIDENNNVILCYEFIVIYAKFLELLGINYEIDKNGKYAKEHINLCIQYKDSKIIVEPTRGVIDCDLTNAKIGVKLEGFNYNYSNPSTYNEINDAVNKVYDHFNKKLGIKYRKQIDLITISKRIFKKQNDNIVLKDRFEIFVKKLINLKLPPIEIVKQLNILKKVVFEDLNIFDFYLIADTDQMSYPNNVSISLVLVYNEFGIDKKDNEYYIYRYPFSIKKVSKEYLQRKFDDGKYKYVKAHRKDIPGIVYESKLVKKIKRK